MIAVSLEPAVNHFGEKPPALLRPDTRRKDFSRLTTTAFRFRDKNGGFVKKDEANDPAHVSGISSGYKTFNLRSLTLNIIDNIRMWQDSGESIFYAYSIRQQIDLHAEALAKDSESRLLVGLLELVFQNNNWANLDNTALDTLADEIKRFADGEMTHKSLVTFSRQIFRSKLEVFKMVADTPDGQVQS